MNRNNPALVDEYLACFAIQLPWSYTATIQGINAILPIGDQLSRLQAELKYLCIYVSGKAAERWSDKCELYGGSKPRFLQALDREQRRSAGWLSGLNAKALMERRAEYSKCGKEINIDDGWGIGDLSKCFAMRFPAAASFRLPIDVFCLTRAGFVRKALDGLIVEEPGDLADLARVRFMPPSADDAVAPGMWIPPVTCSSCLRFQEARDIEWVVNMRALERMASGWGGRLPPNSEIEFFCLALRSTLQIEPSALERARPGTGSLAGVYAEVRAGYGWLGIHSDTLARKRLAEFLAGVPATANATGEWKHYFAQRMAVGPCLVKAAIPGFYSCKVCLLRFAGSSWTGLAYCLWRRISSDKKSK